MQIADRIENCALRLYVAMRMVDDDDDEMMAEAVTNLCLIIDDVLERLNDMAMEIRKERRATE